MIGWLHKHHRVLLWIVLGAAAIEFVMHHL
jgi:hypothetical protein